MTARVAVTTTTGRAADRVGGMLEAEHLLPVYLPCIRVEPAPDAVLERVRRRASDADWIVLTSRRAVEIVWPDGDMPSRPAVAAVGVSTAETARRSGARVEMVGEEGAAGLVRELVPHIGGARVVFPAAGESDPEHVRRLAEHAGELVAEAVYRTVPIPPGDDDVDAAVFGSPSSVRGWRLSRTLEGLVTGAIGATTAAFLDDVGYPPSVIPDRPRMEALVTALAERLREHDRSHA